jgi:hypothetical protein
VSIARRLQDPLSELVKIEPKHIGVGMYQVHVPFTLQFWDSLYLFIFSFSLTLFFFFFFLCSSLLQMDEQAAKSVRSGKAN